jgi:hypothetical protein
LDDVGSWGKSVENLEGATVGWLEALVSFNWKSLNTERSVAGCKLKLTVGSCALFSDLQ